MRSTVGNSTELPIATRLTVVWQTDTRKQCNINPQRAIGQNASTLQYFKEMGCRNKDIKNNKIVQRFKKIKDT